LSWSGDILGAVSVATLSVEEVVRIHYILCADYAEADGPMGMEVSGARRFSNPRWAVNTPDSAA